MTILFYSNRASNGLNNLKNAINEATRGMAVRLRAEGSTRRILSTDLLVNWGCSQMTLNMQNVNNDRYLNSATAVANAANKKKSFELFQRDSVPTVEWTADRTVAQGWLDSGAIVYSRTRLSGHSGEGIVLSFNNPAGVGDAGNSFTVQSDLPNAPLYTKAVMGQRREWRVHVMNGTVIHVQQKKRANGFEENANYSNLVRNHSTGWIYATSDIQLPAGVDGIAVRAIAALGLDFGAVDIITRQGNTYVLEVNTACGQEAGQTLEAYVRSLIAVHNREPIPAAVQPTATGTTDSDVSVEQAPVQTRNVDTVINEVRAASNSLRSYINSTAFLSVDAGFHRTAFARGLEEQMGRFEQAPLVREEETMSFINRVRGAIRRFHELADPMCSTWAAVSGPVRMVIHNNTANIRAAQTTWLRENLKQMVRFTAADVTAAADIITGNFNQAITTGINQYTAMQAAHNTRMEERRQAMQAQAAQPAPVQAATSPLTEDQQLELTTNFAEWVRTQTRHFGVPMSVLLAQLSQDTGSNLR